MGTNYYLHFNHCNYCNRSEKLHIGKSSIGWVFHFQSYDDRKLKTVADWKEFLKLNRIFDEYGSELFFDDFWGLVKSKNNGHIEFGIDQYLDEGCIFSKYEFT